MARIRTIRPEFWEEEPVGALSFPARLLALGMTNYADDEGLVRWSAEYLRGALFRFDESKGATLERVVEWMKEVEDRGLVYVYSSSRVRFKIACILGFRTGPLAQRVDKPKPATLPVPNWHDPAVVLVYARRDEFTCRHCGDPVNEGFSQDQALAPFNPVCERIRQSSEKFHSTDDPSNIAVVHVACAKDPNPDGGRAPITAIPGSFQEQSTNVPGSILDRPGISYRPEPPIAQHVRVLMPAAQAPRVLTGEVIQAPRNPGTIQERSRNDLRHDDQRQCAANEAQGALEGTDDGLFPITPASDARPATGGRGAKRGRASADPATLARRKEAHELTVAWWESLETRPSARHAFMATKKIIEGLLEAGHQAEAIATAAKRCGFAVTIASIEFQLRRLAEQAEREGAGSGIAHLADYAHRPATTDVRLAEARSATDHAARLLERMRTGRTG